MRRLILCLLAVCTVVAPAASVEPAAGGNGTMCVLHAKLAAKNETTGSTSTATGHTQIKVWSDGTITFKTQIFNPSSEMFIAGHIHQAPVGMRHLVADQRLPFREHIHAVVRTPNGNDYGKDLLRQHYMQYPHSGVGQ